MYGLFNSVEVEFADQNRKDQQNTVRVTTPNSDRNPNEPDNELKYRLDLVNDNLRAEALANIDLNQSRVSTVLQFESDFSGLQTDVGDVIKVTNDLYGFSDKLFRVMRCTEKQTDEGMVTVQMSCIEYSDDYYTEANVTESAVPDFIDIPKLPVVTPLPIPVLFSNDGYSNVGTLPGSVFGNVMTNEALKTFGAGVQIEDANLSNTSLANGNTFIDVITPAEFDIKGIDIGDYSFDAFGTPGS